MNRLKLSFIIVTVFFIFAFTSESYATSFNCAKASTLVEKAICSDSQLSNLDDLLMQTYKRTVLNTTDKKLLKNEQLTWLKSRNQCTDTNCIREAYEMRINELNTLSPQKSNLKNIVTGRCHMDGCWWWKVEKTKSIQSESKGELIEVTVRITEAEYSSAEVDKKGYPDFPAKNTQWEQAREVFILCSKTFPTYIAFDEETKKFTGTMLGNSSGATEGIENLYSHICNGNSQFNSNSEVADITLDKPTDIFNFSAKFFCKINIYEKNNSNLITRYQSFNLCK